MIEIEVDVRFRFWVPVPELDGRYLRVITSVDSREIAEGVVLDYNASGRLVGIDIDEASKRVQMDKLVLSQLPSTVETVAA